MHGFDVDDVWLEGEEGEEGNVQFFILPPKNARGGTNETATSA